jgi:hypothetical protein
VSLVFTPSAASLTLTVSGTVTDAQLEIGAMTDYQRVGVSRRYDVSEAGQPQVYFVSPNGLNDFMVSAANVDFSATDRMFVCGGFTKKADDFGSFVGQLTFGTDTKSWELNQSANLGDASRRTYRLGVFDGPGASDFAARSIGLYAAPETAVLSGQLVISASGVTNRVPAAGFRRNGAEGNTLGTSTSGTSSAAFANGLCYIAARAGASTFSAANIYQIVVVGKTPTTSEINQTETFVAAKTKGSLA